MIQDNQQIKKWLAGLALVLVLLLAVGIYALSSGARLQDLASLGYPGVFLVMLLSGSAIVLPLPGPPAVIAAGAIWNPVLVGIAAGLGNATGELLSYATGRAAGSAFERYRQARLLSLLEHWLDRHGFLTVMILAAIPNPAFHALSILAGTVSYPARRFWLACVLGNSVKYAAMAFLGHAALSLIWPW
jgi:uncharacterized membrane protein YdjX (TVP38/TMEM64 family)